MTLAIGIGSLLHGDDAAGRLAARMLLEENPALDVREVLLLTPELAEDVAAADAVLFLDASISAGTVELAEVVPGSAADQGHAGTPQSLLALAAAVYGRSPGRCALLKIPASGFGLGEELTPRTAAAVRGAVSVAAAWLSG